MSKVLYHETYIENGTEYDRAVTCCMAFLRHVEWLERIQEMLSELVYQVQGHQKWEYRVAGSGRKEPYRFCPHCGETIEKESG